MLPCIHRLASITAVRATHLLVGSLPHTRNSSSQILCSANDPNVTAGSECQLPEIYALELRFPI